MMKTRISIVIFFWSVILYCINLQYNSYNDFNIMLFWLSIIILFGVVIYQILSLKKNPFILFEIFIIFFLLHLVYQLGYFGLRGSDTYHDFNFLKTILNNHHFILGTDMMSGWPLLHIFSSVISIITKIEPLFIAKFIPSFISSIIVIPLYLLAYSIYKNKKIALFSCLVFGTVPQFVSFDALLIRETFALFFLILFFYIFYVLEQRKDYRLKFLLIILIPVIILSHHFTSFMLIIFLTIYVILSKLIPCIINWRNGHQKFTKIDISNFYLLILVGVLFYWIYITTFLFKDFFSIYYELAGIKEFASYGVRIDLGTPIVTLRGNIIYYGFFILNGIICSILMIKIFFKRNEHILEETTFIIFLYFCLFLGFLSLFFIGSLIYPDRLLPFGLMFGLIPLIAFLFSLKKTAYKKVFLIIVISFIIFNIYNINPTYYTGKASLEGNIATEKEYAIAETINIPNMYYGYIGASNAIHDVQGINFINMTSKNPITTLDFFNTSQFAIINEGLYLRYLENTKFKSPTTYERISTVLSYKNSYDINKISDLGDIHILGWKK